MPADELGLELLICGVGPVDAAARTAAWLAAAPPSCVVVHVGIAGAHGGTGIEVGDVVIGQRAVWADTTSRLVTTSALPDPGLLARVCAALPRAHVADIGTSADVGGTHMVDVAVEAMEGFAVLRAAALAGVPAVEVRVIANEVDEPDRTKWRFDLALATLADITPALCAAARTTAS